MAMTTQDRFGGVWTVTRETEDFASGQPGRFRGLARIRAESDGLIYEEHGRLILGAAKMQASRRYRWRPEGGTQVAVLFEDGRAFHRFDWGRAVSTDSHQCGEDRYEVRYSFGEERWHAHWRVTGPDKDYKATSLYLRPMAGDVAMGTG